MFEKLKSSINIRQTNQFKINVTFAAKAATGDCEEVTENMAREEANFLSRCVQWNRKYRIFISEKLVEVIGCIHWSIADEIEELKNLGDGKFKNPLLPTVAIVDATHFEKFVDGSN
jgi:hypothetical protein